MFRNLKLKKLKMSKKKESKYFEIIPGIENANIDIR